VLTKLVGMDLSAAEAPGAPEVTFGGLVAARPSTDDIGAPCAWRYQVAKADSYFSTARLRRERYPGSVKFT
jgi:hypothetical protein